MMILMKKGDKIKIIRMDDKNGADYQAAQMNGKIVTVKFIDGNLIESVYQSERLIPIRDIHRNGDVFVGSVIVICFCQGNYNHCFRHCKRTKEASLYYLNRITHL